MILLDGVVLSNVAMFAVIVVLAIFAIFVVFAAFATFVLPSERCAG